REELRCERRRGVGQDTTASHKRRGPSPCIHRQTSRSPDIASSRCRTFRANEEMRWSHPRELASLRRLPTWCWRNHPNHPQRARRHGQKGRQKMCWPDAPGDVRCDEIARECFAGPNRMQWRALLLFRRSAIELSRVRGQSEAYATRNAFSYRGAPTDCVELRCDRLEIT